MSNQNLGGAKMAKNDEFYTQLTDINKEIQAYLDYNPDIFRDKTVLLPCDDPKWSNFTKFFALNFQLFGIKRLISTSYALDAKKAKYGIEPSLFPEEEYDPKFDPSKWQTRGKIFILDRDINGDDRIDFDDTYRPGNCRWVDEIAQANNKSNNHVVEYKGRRQTLSQWARELGVNYDKLKYRVRKGGTLDIFDKTV